MPGDPLFVALKEGRPLTLGGAALAKQYRMAQIDQLWVEIKILEELIRGHPGPHPALAERDPPIEAP